MSERHQKLINGKPVSCRTCRFVMDSTYRWTHRMSTHGPIGDFCRVVCCRLAPPTEFIWTQIYFEPFCGQYEPDETPVVKDSPRTMPAPNVRDRVRDVFPDAIPIYGVEVPATKLSEELRRALFPHVDSSCGDLPQMPQQPPEAQE